MKQLSYILVFGCLFLSCIHQEEIPEFNGDYSISEAISIAGNACNGEKMEWLEDLLIKAEEDRVSMAHKGRYIGWISRTTYQEKPHFVVMFATDALGFQLFDCSGNWVHPKEGEKFPSFLNSPDRGEIIYSNLRD